MQGKKYFILTYFYLLLNLGFQVWAVNFYRLLYLALIKNN